MKKTMIGLLALTMALMVICSACGGNETKESENTPTEAPEATELPKVTAKPQEGEDTPAMKTADENSAPEDVDVEKLREEKLAAMSEDAKTAMGLVGQSVKELYAAIGQPQSKTYVASCYVSDGQDGALVYDGFTVNTTVFSSGEELVMGVE